MKPIPLPRALAALDQLSTMMALKYYRGGMVRPTKRDNSLHNKPIGVNLGWKEGELTVNAGGHRFTSRMNRAGETSFEEVSP